MQGRIGNWLNKRRSLKSVLLAQFAFILFVYLSLKTFPVIRSQTRKFLSGSKFKSFLISPSSPSKINIGIVVCTGPDFNVTSNREPAEAMTLIKSLIISTTLYNFVGGMELHIFYDHSKFPAYFNRVMAAVAMATKSEIKVTFQLHNAFSVLPPKYVETFVKVEYPCKFLRLFFPEVLSSLDQILYLDNDILITGNIAEIWNSFQRISPTKLVGMAKNNEVEDGNHLAVEGRIFGDIPHLTAKGVNSGVMYMNLETMRKQRWTELLLGSFEKFKAVVGMSDQRLLNIKLHNNPELVEILPCHFNFQYLHCDRGLTCREAVDDPTGIQILHGTGNRFHQAASSNHLMYKAYAEFDLASKEGIIDGLLKPLKKRYTEEKSSATCNGLMGPLLFKDLI